MVKRNAVAKGRWTYRKVHGFKNLYRLLALWTTRGYTIEHHGDGLIASEPDEFNGRGNRLKVID